MDVLHGHVVNCITPIVSPHVVVMFMLYTPRDSTCDSTPDVHHIVKDCNAANKLSLATPTPLATAIDDCRAAAKEPLAIPLAVNPMRNKQIISTG